jgi:hypothetical protein
MQCGTLRATDKGKGEKPMKKVELKYLFLSNFKGIKEFEIPDFENGIEIHGDNGTGKTTIFDAFSWLLFGKDSLNSGSFDIKCINEKGEVLHGLNHLVTAKLTAGNGDIDLTKVYYEKYTKRRGQSKKTFTGHTIDHFINNVPCKQKEFTAAINDICTEDVFKLLTNPRHFNEVLHWTDRRNLLFQMCGDIPDEAVIASNPALARLPEILGGHSLADTKKINKSLQSEINAELEKIPVKIAEISASKIEVDNDALETKAKLEKYKETKAKKTKELAALKAGGGIAEKEKELSELESNISKREYELDMKRDKQLADQREEFNRLDNIAIGCARDTEKAVIRQSDLIKREKELKNQLAQLEVVCDQRRKMWFELDKQEFTPIEGSDICPACGQALPAESVKEASRLALEAFNESKAKDLAVISEQGKKTKAEIEALKLDIGALSKEIKTMDLGIKALAETQDGAERAMDECKARHEKENATIAPDEKLQKMKSAQTALLLEINGLRAGTYEAVLAVEGEIDRIENYINILTKDALQIEANERVDKRVKFLLNRERELSQGFEKLEEDNYIIDTFIRTKAAMLDKKIIKKFKLATFRLFTENINGGIEETCDTTIDGVPYTSLNNGGRINVGLDICNTLSEYYGISLPVFIDNSEAVTDLLDTNSQQIRMYVNASDKKLRIKKLEKEKKP